jgi:hypothetical protein
LDPTAWVAITRIAGTLIAAIFAPVAGEMARCKTVRKERLLELRLLPTRTSKSRCPVRQQRDEFGIHARGRHPEPNDEELNRLTGQVKLVASNDVAKHFKMFSEQIARFHSDVWVARFHRRVIALRNPEDDSALEGVQTVDRIELGCKVDAIRGTYHELEAAIRKDVQSLRLQRLTCARGVYDLADTLHDLCRLLEMDSVATLGDDQAAVRRQASHDLLCFLPEWVVIDVLSRCQDDERCDTKRRRRLQQSVAVHFRPPSARAFSICCGRACRTPMAVRVSGERFSLPGSALGHAGAHSRRTSPNLAIHLIMF